MMQRHSHKIQIPKHPKLFSLKIFFTTSIKCLGLDAKFEAKPKISRSFLFSRIPAQPSLKWSLTLTFCHPFLQHPTFQTSHTYQIYRSFVPFFFWLSTNYDMSRFFFFFSHFKIQLFYRESKKEHMVRISFQSRRNQSQQRRICCYAHKKYAFKARMKQK